MKNAGLLAGVGLTLCNQPAPNLPLRVRLPEELPGAMPLPVANDCCEDGRA